MEDEVVISGVGGHFPECDNLREYSEKLLQNLHLISSQDGELQPRYTLETAMVSNGPLELDKDNLKSGKMRFGDKFDNTFFGMHSRLAAATDAITRHVLETTMEAVLDAGYSPKDLHGTNTGVFMGYHCSESESNFIRESADGFGIMGLNAAMTANRVSYWLDLKGTSFTHNTQLVSGMQGLDMAFKALVNGELDRAVVGSASLSYLTELATHYDDLGWLSASGSCKPFDQHADGGVRSEAVVVMLLERRSTARRVYASVVHTKSSFYSEHSRSEIAHLERPVLGHLLRSFYSECNVNPNDISYVEADGWGVPGVDESEIGALDDVIARRRSQPLLIGSVKGNIGQTEAASGLASLCKALVAMESGTIPATINHIKANSKLAGICEGRMQVVTENRPLPAGLVAVNNLGLGGLLGHVLLKANPRTKPPLPQELPFPKLLLMSGRTPEGLEAIIKDAEDNANDPEFVHLVHSAFSSHIFGHMYRGYTIAPKQQPGQVKFYTGQKRPVWFVYSGMGSQWPGMAADLMRLPVFAAAVERCHAALVPLGVDLKHIITTTEPSIYDNILHSFVGIAAVQVGLTDVLRTVGIEATGIIGHSVGELGCAYADGCITAEQMMLAAHARGQASNEAELIPGIMAAVGMGYKDIKDMLPEEIEVACHNSSASCTLSGPTAAMNTFVAELKAKGVFARAVNVSNIAYHSRYIRPAAPRLLELLKGVILEPKKRSALWVSTSTNPDAPKTDQSDMASAEYFTNNLLSSVYFEEGCTQIPADALAIEIAPHGLLQAILKRSLNQDAVNIAMTKRDSPGTTMVLDALGKLYMEGLLPRVDRLYPPVETPVSRGTAVLSTLATWDHRDTWPVAFLKAPADYGPHCELTVPLALSCSELSHLADCTWNGHSVLTPATCIAFVINIVKSYATEAVPIVLQNVVFYDVVPIPEEGKDEVYVFVQRASGRFEVSVKGRLVMVGTANQVDDDRAEKPPPTIIPREQRLALDAECVYEELGRRGLVCRGEFRSLVQLQQGARAWLGASTADKLGMQLEALLQVVLLQCAEGSHQLHAPHRIQRITLDPAADTPHGLVYDLARRSLRLSSPSGTLEVVGVDTRLVSLAPTFPPILVQAKTFIPYRDTVKEVSHLASLALQVAAFQGRLPLHVGELTAPNGGLLRTLEEAAQQQLPDLHVRVEHGASENTVLLVSDAAGLSTALAALAAAPGRSVLLAELPAGFATPPGLTELLSLDTAPNRYALLKHEVEVDADSEVVHCTEVPDDRLALSQSPVVYLVFRDVPMQRIPQVMRTLAVLPGGSRAHCVFLQDPAAPAFSVDTPLYGRQLRLGLRVNVLQGGRWGGMFRHHIAQLRPDAAPATVLRRNTNLTISNMQVRCVAVNPTAEDSNLLEYAAVEAGTGSRLMGVCTSSADPLQPDPVLAWTVPAAWSDEEACTVPLAYATALYALLEQMATLRGERALVVGGSTALGQAAIALLLDMECKVVATVASPQEQLQVSQRFPQVQVVAGSPDEYFRTLRRTMTTIDVALIQGDPLTVKTVFPLLKKYGRAVYVGPGTAVRGHSVGLSNFLGSTAMYSVTWTWPLTAREDAKKRVRESLRGAIQRGVVRPLPRPAPAPAKGAVSGARPLLDAARSCLVVAVSAARAVSVTEWLLSSGARQVAVWLAGRAAGRATGASWLQRRLALLSAHYGSTVRLLAPTDQAAPLGLVIALDQQVERVRSLDAMTRGQPSCSLVVLVSGGQDTAELSDLVRCRREQGYPAVLACMGDLPADVSLLPLQQVLGAASNPAVHFLDVLQVVPQEGNDLIEGSSAALTGLLPNSVEALRRLGLSLADSVQQRTLTSLIGGSKDRRNKEVPSVFLVGGLSDAAVQELGPVARHIMGVAVLVTPPARAATVQEAAAAVLPVVLAAQPRGPYTLVGRGWGGCVALEVAAALTQADNYVTVFLMDASPDALQAALRPLQNQPSGLRPSLLKYLLKIDRETEQLVLRAPEHQQVVTALGARDAVLEAALSCVLQRIEALLDYRPPALGPRVALSLISNHKYHLQSNQLAEAAAELRSFAVQGNDSTQSATVISSGIHVGRLSMRERKALGCLNVSF